MSRNLYKIIQNLEDEVKLLKRKVSLLETQCDHLETLLRLKDKIPERPIFPYEPTSPWYKEPTLSPPYKVTCSTKDEKTKELESDPFVDLLLKSLGLQEEK